MLDKNKEAIRCENYGPNFGNCDMKLNSNLKEGQTYANCNCNYYSNNNLELTGGKGGSENFETNEFEVYRVIFI